jgi:hypothetical protein
MEQIAPYVHHTLATVSSHEKQALRMNRKVSLETGVCAYEDASSSSNYEKKAKYVKESQRIVFCFFCHNLSTTLISLDSLWPLGMSLGASTPNKRSFKTESSL